LTIGGLVTMFSTDAKRALDLFKPQIRLISYEIWKTLSRHAKRAHVDPCAPNKDLEKLSCGFGSRCR